MLDARKEELKTRRLFFLDHEDQNTLNKSITIRKKEPWTHNFKAYLPSSTIHDKLTPIDVQVSYSMAQQRSLAFGRQRGGQRFRGGSASLSPVLGQKDKKAVDTVLIKKNCGGDGRCVPNLSVEAGVAGTYVVGAGKDLEIIATVFNEGNGAEDAFNAMLYVQIPQGVNYNKASVPCSKPSPSNNMTLKCEIGNPLPPGRGNQVSCFWV